ncbi:succinylglutamate desuccinylase/aspartoacylase family protein [Rapidithrix thailandica]|uniref:Succinylglutamate desuccinylase/aspartoacylase family protein n=1 Tax=Rapidithrix thailandica TaxID=413964 RepID=A0AAW9S4N6_9BACT
MKTLFINQTEIVPGESTKIDVNIALLPSHTPINITISVSRAKTEGPVLLLMGGLHGDEINGIEIVRRIIEQSLHVPECGTVICIPILNIYGFINFSREVPDGKDINRSFPGNKNGSLASRVASYLMRHIVPQIDYGVDFHTGGASRSNYPQVRCDFHDAQSQALAEAFHAPFTLNSRPIAKSLRQAASKLGKRILVYEGGESLRFDEFAIAQGIAGTLRLMHSLHMVSQSPLPDHPNQIIKNSSWIRAKNSGLFSSYVHYGEKVYKNQVLGTLTDSFGDFKVQIKAPYSGYIIGINHLPVVHQGDALVHLGVLK